MTNDCHRDMMGLYTDSEQRKISDYSDKDNIIYIFAKECINNHYSRHLLLRFRTRARSKGGSKKEFYA